LNAAGRFSFDPLSISLLICFAVDRVGMEGSMKTPLILLATSCGCALLGWGICGQAHGDNEAFLGLIVLGLSALGAVVAVIWMLVRLMMGSSK
jgi:hypothetical protein